MKSHLAVNYSDSRGTIRDIFVSSPKDHCSIITFAVNAVRANHYHKESTQYTYVISGQIQMASAIVDENGNVIGQIEHVVLCPGDLVTHPPYNAHAFKANTESSILAFADGVRGGGQYENDVFRLDPPLL